VNQFFQKLLFKKTGKLDYIKIILLIIVSPFLAAVLIVLLLLTPFILIGSIKFGNGNNYKERIISNYKRYARIGVESI